MHSQYSIKVIEHFMAPHNVGSMIDYDGIGTYGDPSCGDSLTIYIKVKDNIIEEALKIEEEDIVEALDGLPENKLHCSNLGVQALRNAIKDYLNQKDKREL